MTFFIPTFPRRMVVGWRPDNTVIVFDHGFQEIGDLTETDTGFGPIAAGIGSQTSALPGQPITTADGSILPEQDGAGSREINGRRPGYPGEKVMITWDGLRSRPKQMSPRMDRYRLGLTRIMVLARLLTFLSAMLIGTNRAMRSTSGHTNKTLKSLMRAKTLPTSSPITM